MWQHLLILVPLVTIILEMMQPAVGRIGQIATLGCVIGLGIFFGIQKGVDSEGKELFFAAVTSAVGALGTFILANHFSFGAVVASGLVGVAGGRLQNEDRQLQLYLGAFVGMSSTLRFPGMIPLAVAGAAGGLLFELMSDSWVGVGGRLGTLAATGVLIVLLLSGGVW